MKGGGEYRLDRPTHKAKGHFPFVQSVFTKQSDIEVKIIWRNNFYQNIRLVFGLDLFIEIQNTNQ